MQKRLRYAMPRKPLQEYRVQNLAEGEDGIPLEVVGSNVGVMAKRIRQMEMKKHQVYQSPAERPLAGDLSSSESDQSDTDSADASLINE